MTDKPPQPPDSPSSPPPANQPSVQIQGGPIPPQILAQMLGGQGGFLPGPGGIQLTLPGIIQQQAQMWQGPYPPPDAVERYEKVLPGTFNRLITMAEQLQTAQVAQSADAVQLTRVDRRRGHWLGFVTTIAAMVFAVVALPYNAWVAAAFLSVPVMAVAKALIETSKAPTQADLIKAATQIQPTGPPPLPVNTTIPTPG